MTNQNQQKKPRDRRGQIAERVEIDSPDNGKAPADRRALLRAAHYLGEHAKLLRAFGTDATGRQWADSARQQKVEHDECASLQQQIKKMAQVQRPQSGGMVELEREDI